MYTVVNPDMMCTQVLKPFRESIHIGHISQWPLFGLGQWRIGRRIRLLKQNEGNGIGQLGSDRRLGNRILRPLLTAGYMDLYIFLGRKNR